MWKKFITACLLLQFCLTAEGIGDDSYWNENLVRFYVHNSELQRRWSWAFLAPYIKQLRGDENILDIGCGDGKITADIAKFIPHGTILGVDPSIAMLDWARKQFNVLEYPNLAFQEGGFLENNLIGSFDIIFSNCALQHCQNQPLALKNLKKLLKLDGKLLISLPARDNSKWNEALQTVQKLPQWSSYWKNWAPRRSLSVEEYTRMVTEAGLHPIKVIKITSIDPFVDREDFVNFLLGTFPPAVPKELAREFYNDVIDEYLRLLPDAINSQGVIESRYGRIEIEAVHVEASTLVD